MGVELREFRCCLSQVILVRLTLNYTNYITTDVKNSTVNVLTYICLPVYVLNDATDTHTRHYYD